ncbi:hypothetical protein TRIP_C90233 [Candidatus Zixiibacteriota bacterium]|nr:hypothetical protein TRIP_C90233 [candidate division Zixibacteria bacterium]
MKRTAFLLALLAVISGCGKDKGNGPDSETATIWPLQIGSQWTYEEIEYDSAGHITAVDTTILAVADDTIIGNERWYILTSNGIADQEIGPITNRNDGLWAGGISGTLQFKYPAGLNDTFMMGSQVSIVESIHDSITVPAGVFICYNYKWLDDSTGFRAFQYHYLSTEIGFVMAVEYYRTQSGTIYPGHTSELISYLLNKELDGNWRGL